jgi:hypothetical protein
LGKMKSLFLIFLLTISKSCGTLLTKTQVQVNLFLTLVSHSPQNTGAICADSSAASYYQRLLSSSNRWVIYVEDGPPSCIGLESSCNHDIQKFPYFQTSQDSYRPKTVDSTTFLSDDPNSSPWPLSNLIYLNYCSMDGWLGSLLPPKYEGGYYFRGSINFRYSLTQILGTKTIPIAKRYQSNPSDPAEIILIGSGVGAMGVTFHLQWLLNDMGFSSRQIRVVHDSFFIPTATIPLNDVS